MLNIIGRIFGQSQPVEPEPGTGPILVLCHCHYPELVPELLRTLRWLPTAAALHVSSSRPEVLATWQGLTEASSRPIALHLSENRGRDLRPFFEWAGLLPVTDETLILKLHGKKSAYTAKGDQWRRQLLHGLLPGPSAVRDAALRFRREPNLAMLGPPGAFISHPVYWGRNRDTVSHFMQQACGSAPTEADLGFFAGSMFWTRGAFLKKFVSLVDLAAFEPEPLGQDGGYAHMIERALPMAARRMGYHLAEIGRAGPIEPEHVAARKIRFI